MEPDQPSMKGALLPGYSQKFRDETIDAVMRTRSGVKRLFVLSYQLSAMIYD